MRWFVLALLAGCYLSHRVEGEELECTGEYPECIRLDRGGCCTGPDTFPECIDETWACPVGSIEIDFCEC